MRIQFKKSIKRAFAPVRRKSPRFWRMKIMLCVILFLAFRNAALSHVNTVCDMQSVLPHTLQLDGYLSVCCIEYIFAKDKASLSDILFDWAFMVLLYIAQIVDALLMNLPYTVYYLFGTYEREFLLKELYKFLLSFCNCYPSFPDCLFGVSQIHQPIIKLFKSLFLTVDM